ncbi:MAG: M67 family metallopeptidase, partial [Ferrovibrio sp.]
MTALRLSAAQVAALAALAEAAFPREACALLVGTESLRVTEIVPAKNVSTDPEREFELDPAVHIATLRRLRDAGGTNSVIGHRIIGHWHSHPNGRAEPSAKDAAMVSDPGLVWLITAVHDGRALPVRA